MRALIFELRPRGLETDGLSQALRNHASAVAGRHRYVDHRRVRNRRPAGA
jgi:signal transduction histidine kinase